ncbi:hypothetical protein V6N11_079359 [Hibiscus sabdariffa]|uniref:Uncharacterized protein n=1 Tax=Hibiscus sabdariffa TaxID=183260 RepID=A0ABR2RVP9_9ROSI
MAVRWRMRAMFAWSRVERRSNQVKRKTPIRNGVESSRTESRMTSPHPINHSLFDFFDGPTTATAFKQTSHGLPGSTTYVLCSLSTTRSFVVLQWRTLPQ